MICAGFDLGISTAKITILRDHSILTYQVLPYKGYPQEAVEKVMEMALTAAGSTSKDIAGCLATGLGARAVRYADGTVADTVALHRAIEVLNPSVRTIINVGGHSFMAFNVTQAGEIGESAITDRCAAGTGIILDLMSRVLETPLEELIRTSESSDHTPYINSQCPIFIESEVVSLINDGWDRYAVFAGVAEAVATRIAGLVGRVDLDPEIVLTGGVAKNRMVVAGVERRLGLKMAAIGGMDPQIIGAFGAALIAADRMRCG